MESGSDDRSAIVRLLLQSRVPEVVRKVSIGWARYYCKLDGLILYLSFVLFSDTCSSYESSLPFANERCLSLMKDIKPSVEGSVLISGPHNHILKRLEIVRAFANH